MNTTTLLGGSLALLVLIAIGGLLVLLMMVVARSIHRSISNATEERRKREKPGDAADPWAESGRRVRVKDEEE